MPARRVAAQIVGGEWGDDESNESAVREHVMKTNSSCCGVKE